MPGVATVYRWELTKLRYQKRTYLGLAVAILVPVLYVIAIAVRRHHERGGGFAFTDYVDKSGLAIPLVGLLFGAIWMFPLIAALVAGDIVASEDHNGTLKTIFTRSLERWQLFAGKALVAATYAVVAMAVFGTVAVIAGSLASGFNPLQSLSGTIVSAPRALALVYAALAVYMIPLAAIVCIGLLLSTVTHNSAAAVVGTLMVSLVFQLLGILPGLSAIQPYLHPVQRLAGVAADPDRLGADHPRRVGVRDLRRGLAGGGVYRVRAPRRRGWLRCSPGRPAAASACWSSTTTRRCGGCCGARSPPRASRSPSPPTGRRRWWRPSARRLT